jgi:nucleoid-associated protein YgaU
MVSRKQKLIAASAVLAVGLGLSLLFRRTGPVPAALTLSAPALAATAPVTPTPLVAAAIQDQRSPLESTPAMNAALSYNHVPVTAGIDSAPQPPEDDDSATGRPVYASVGGDAQTGAASNSSYRIHVVHNGDTLERLAERYLADSARALELFDLNRDLLENPHLLPIGAELRIPANASETSD